MALGSPACFLARGVGNSFQPLKNESGVGRGQEWPGQHSCMSPMHGWSMGSGPPSLSFVTRDLTQMSLAPGYLPTQIQRCSSPSLLPVFYARGYPCFSLCEHLGYLCEPQIWGEAWKSVNLQRDWPGKGDDPGLPSPPAVALSAQVPVVSHSSQRTSGGFLTQLAQ